MMNLKPSIAVIIGFILTASCSNEALSYNYDGYIGVWKESSTERQSHFRIYKSDKAYYFDAKHTKDALGQPRKPRTLTFNEGQMKLGNAVLSLSTDNNSITLNANVFNRQNANPETAVGDATTPLRSSECIALHREHSHELESIKHTLNDKNTTASQFDKALDDSVRLKEKYNTIFIDHRCSTIGIVLNK